MWRPLKDDCFARSGVGWRPGLLETCVHCTLAPTNKAQAPILPPPRSPHLGRGWCKSGQVRGDVRRAKNLRGAKTWERGQETWVLQPCKTLSAIFRPDSELCLCSYLTSCERSKFQLIKICKNLPFPIFSDTNWTDNELLTKKPQSSELEETNL